MVFRSFEHSKSQYLPSQKNLWLNLRPAFSIFRPHEKVIICKNILTIPMSFFWRKKLGKMSLDFQLYMEISPYFIRWFSFLILNFYKETKQDTKNWSKQCWTNGLVLLFYSCLLHKQTDLIFMLYWTSFHVWYAPSSNSYI